MFFLFREVSVLTGSRKPEFQVTEVRLMCWKIEVAWKELQCTGCLVDFSDLSLTLH